MDERRRQGAAFATGGRDYERLRPTYPIETVAWMAGEPQGLPVADVGAGTGKLTARLLDLGHQVIAIDPSRDMLEQAPAHPRLRTHVGSGESTGLPDRSVTTVCYGQAWHWVDPAEASVEAARVLAPGGHLALVWNIIDTTDAAAAAIHDAMRTLDPGMPENDDSHRLVASPLVPDGDLEVRWHARTTTADLAAMVTTRSYYLARPEKERALLREMMAAAVTRHYGPIGDQVAELPYRTVAHRFRRP